MALDLALKLEINNTNSYWIPSSEFNISYDRSPIVQALPGADPITIDLGMWRVTLTINGFVDKSYLPPKTQNGDPILNRRSLEDIGGLTSDGSINLSVTNVMTLYDYTDGSNNDLVEYKVLLRKIALSPKPARDDIEFQMVLEGYTDLIQ